MLCLKVSEHQISSCNGKDMQAYSKSIGSYSQITINRLGFNYWRTPDVDILIFLYWFSVTVTWWK